MRHTTKKIDLNWTRFSRGENGGLNAKDYQPLLDANERNLTDVNLDDFWLQIF
jgi:hypothetical protein